MLPAWLRQNIDKRVVMISGVSVTAALLFWGFAVVLKKLRKKKVLELWQDQVASEKLGEQEKKMVEDKIDLLSSQELKMLIEAVEKNKELDMKMQINTIENEERK